MFQNDSLFGRFMNLMFDVICIGLMWVISSIPLVTMGTATTAAYYTMAKCVRYKSGYVTKEFFSAFRKNFRQTIGFNVLFLFLFLMLAVELKFAWDHDFQGIQLRSEQDLHLRYTRFLLPEPSFSVRSSHLSYSQA